MFKTLSLTVAALTALALSSSAANAAVYNIDIPFQVSGTPCVAAGNVKTCSRFFLLSNAIASQPGDTFNVDVTYDRRAHVGGAATESLVFSLLVDSSYPTPNRSGPDFNLSTASMTGYIGQAGFFTGPYLQSFRGGFLGSTGFFGSPSTGFSLTGVDYTLNLFTPDPYPIIGVSIGSAVAVPEPATWAMMLAGFAGIGFAARRQRRQAPSAA
jgi:PEP-CTERM motif